MEHSLRLEPNITPSNNPTLYPDLVAEIEWVTNVINTRFELYFSLEASVNDILELKPPGHSGIDTPFYRLLSRYKFNFDERVAIALCLLSRLRPQSLDVFFTKNKTFDKNFTEFGGVIKPNNGGFLPTGETLLFLLAGSDVSMRLEKMKILHRNQPLFKYHILELVDHQANSPRENDLIRLSHEIEAQLLWQESYRPEFGSRFPASPLTTSMDWDDLVLPHSTAGQVAEITTWIKHGRTLMDEWEMGKKLRPGHRSLFYGPPGTGKTLTAALLGKSTGRDVYRVDLSLVISKYIGETEKNLAKVFDMAEYRDWILFFDEADALFGKRTQVQDAHDRYANQEVSYLLQRIEVFDGIVILASNQKSNIDEAFSRRFESIIHFPMPRVPERTLIWSKGFSTKAKEALSPDVNLKQIAQDHELSGGSIMNVIRRVSLQAIAQEKAITVMDIIAGIKHEFAKEGKTIR